MKKILMGILSLSTLFIFSTITYAEYPDDGGDESKTPSSVAFRKPQSSEYLRGKARQHVRNCSSLDLSSTSEVVGLSFDNASRLSEEEQEQEQEVSSTEAEEILKFIEETTGSPSFVDMQLENSDDEHPLQKLLESSKRGF